MERGWLAASIGVVPLYGSADVNVPREDELLCGMCAQVLEDQGDWMYVRAEYGFEGFVQTKRMSALREDWRAAPKRQVKALFADVLAGPSVKTRVIENLPRGSRVAVLDERRGIKTGWCPVMLPDGRRGFMQMSWLMPLYDGRMFGETRLRESVVEMAKSYLGVAYRWGGKTPMGIDCSGLTFMSYWMYGITIYRNAEIKKGFAVKAIAPEAAKPGDLLYFPGHVAMVLDADTYIHATGRAGSDGVVVNSLRPGDPRYREDLRERLLTAGTVF